MIRQTAKLNRHQIYHVYSICQHPEDCSPQLGYTYIRIRQIPSCPCYKYHLSMMILNSRDWHEYIWLPISENNLTICSISFKYWPYTYIYWYNAINTINPFKQLKCALESKLPSFKTFKNCKNFRVTHWPQQSTYRLNY